MKKTILIFTLVFILTLLVGAILFNYVITGEIIDTAPDREFDYQWTKAICDGNKCRDYNVTCKDGKVLDMVPITGEVIFDENWIDPREINDSLCER